MGLGQVKIGLCIVWVSFFPASLLASSFDVDASLNERAKWRSFGVKNWTEFDPVERAYPSRRPVLVDEWNWPTNTGTIGQLKSLIAHAEAGRKGYDAIHVSARVTPRLVRFWWPLPKQRLSMPPWPPGLTRY